MRLYEGIVIFPSQYAGEKLEEVKKVFEDQILKQDGKVLGKREMGKRSFGYPIKKQREGLFMLYDFELAPNKVSDLKKAVALMDDVLRFSFFVKEQAPAQPPAAPA